MAAGTFVPVEQYLSAGYQPDREYIEGEIRERNTGGLKDGALRARLAGILQAWQDQMQVDVLLQKRLRIAPERFRVPDICVIRRDSVTGQASSAPIVCIDVLSTEDSVEEMTERARDYLDMGVAHVWVLDPFSKQAYEFGPAGLNEVTTGSLAAPALRLDILLTELFVE
ncbi:MAG: Uma2 family endonuclease [Acidobacteriota bacterium]|nr:Uma2 family endonuclease [Acidobacteriota bacterium]